MDECEALMFGKYSSLIRFVSLAEAKEYFPEGARVFDVPAAAESSVGRCRLTL